MTDTTPPLHDAQGDKPMIDGYTYNAGGIGVRNDLIAAVLIAWARVSPTGEPILTLRSAGDGAINKPENIARMAAMAVAEILATETAS